MPIRVELISGGPVEESPPSNVHALDVSDGHDRTRPWTGFARAFVQGTLVSPPFLATRRVVPLIRRQLTAAPPQFVHLDTMSAAHLIDPIHRLLEELGCDAPVVLSINDSYSLLLRDTSPVRSRVRRELKLAHVRRVERHLLPRATFVDVVSDVDMAWLGRVSPSANVRVIPLGRPTIKTPNLSQPAQHDLLLFSARPGLTAFLRELVSRAEGRSIRVGLVGRNPQSEVLRLLDEIHGVHLGFVEDLAAEIARSRLVVAPSQQVAGASNKAILAMVAGVPVAGGRCLRSLPGVRAGVHCLIEDDAPKLAAATLSALGDPSMLTRIGIAGHELVMTLPDWPHVGELYMQALATPRMGP